MVFTVNCWLLGQLVFQEIYRRIFPCRFFRYHHKYYQLPSYHWLPSCIIHGRGVIPGLPSLFVCWNFLDTQVETPFNHIKQHTSAINKRAFSYSRLPLVCGVFVQNAITKQWEQQAAVKGTHDNGESYVIELANGKQCICWWILLRPIHNSTSKADTSHPSPVQAFASQRSTHPVPFPAPVLHRSGRLQNTVWIHEPLNLYSQLRKHLQVSYCFIFSSNDHTIIIHKFPRSFFR